MSNSIDGLFRAGCWHELVYKNEEENADKFWSIKVLKCSHIRKSGRTGANPRETVVVFDTAEDARQDAKRLYDAQVRQGYKIKKPQLEVATELVHTVTYTELERFFLQVYGAKFNFVYDQECTRNSYRRFYADGQRSTNDHEDIANWVNGEPKMWMAGLLLDDCVRQRLIPAGYYLVEVDW